MAQVKAFLSNAYAKASSVVAMAPFPIGVAVGFLCHAEMKLVLDVAGSVVKFLLKTL